MKTNLSHKKYFLLFVFVMLLVAVAEARFGGGGGGGDSGGGYSGGGYSGGGDYSGGSDYSSSSGSGSFGGGNLGFSILMIILAGIAIVVQVIKGDKNNDDGSYYSSLPKTKGFFLLPHQLRDKLSRIKNFDEREFLQKARTAFGQMQDSWAKKDISITRRFISDGMYQRVNAQLIMMNELGQKNEIEHIKLNELRIVFVEKKEPYDIVYVEYKAYIIERYWHPEFSILNHSYRENFTEYWAFIRKTDNTQADLYNTQNCPKCGAPLQNMGEVSKCHSCGVYTNTGEFDWVISEVIQPDAFARMVEATKHYNSVNSGINNVRHVFPALNVPLLEDKAANAFLQVKIAKALNDPKRIRRFSSDEFYESFSSSPQKSFAYNRLFLHKVSLINIFDSATHYLAAFNLKCTEQKVRIENTSLALLDTALITRDEYLVLAIQKNNRVGQYSIFSYSCPSCGGALNDTGDIHCPYCQNVLNDDTRDWLVNGLYTYADYVRFRSGLKASPRINIATEQKVTDKPMQLRDYALNNILVILNADGQLSTEEKKFALRVAKLLKYRNEELNILWEERNPEKLGIRMPEDKKQQQKIYNLMKKAAHHDDHLAPQELNILDELRLTYKLKA